MSDTEAKLAKLVAATADLAALASAGASARAFIDQLAFRKDEARELAEAVRQLGAEHAAARAELDRLRGQIAAAKQEHQQMEASLASMKKEKTAILDRLAPRAA